VNGSSKGGILVCEECGERMMSPSIGILRTLPYVPLTS